MNFFFFKRKSNKKNLLELSAADQKKIYKQAAEESTKLQTELLSKFETFGERIEPNKENR